MKLKKSSIVAIVAVVGVGAAVFYGVRPKPLLVDTAVVDRRPLEATIEADGRTRVRERYLIVAPVAGRLERIDRLEGSAVRAGDVVAASSRPRRSTRRRSRRRGHAWTRQARSRSRRRRR